MFEGKIMDKKMKILIGNNTLSLLAGSEIFVYTLAQELKKLGHTVHCFSPELGIISNELEKIGIQSFKNISTSGVKPFSIVLEEEIKHDYDVIIANHNHIVSYLRKQFPKTPIISIIHGIIHVVEENGKKIIAPEYPALDSGVNQFISVSEEIQNKLKNDYNVDSLVIRNLFDLKKLKSNRKISNKPKIILFNSNYSLKDSEDTMIVRDVAKHYGARLIALGQNFSWSFDIKKALSDADIVFGMGRSVLEGVAAGRLGIVHGRWGTGGVICEENVDVLKHFNFSGRNADGILLSAEEIIKEIDLHYNQKTIDWGLNYMKLNHNSLTIADSYIRIARELTGESITREKKEPELRPYRRAKDAK